MSLFVFFLPAILASTFTCAVLSLFGSIVIARERITNVLFYSQMAKVGMILGLFFNTVLDAESTFTPFFFSLLFAAIFYIISESIGNKALANKEAIFLALFAIASQIEELFLFVFKGVEKHELGQFYGDIVTIEGEHIFWLSLFSFIFLILFIFYEKKWFVESFNQMILKIKRNDFETFFLYHMSVLFFVTISVLILGLWLTIVSLLVPPIFLSKLPFKSRRSYYLILFLVGSIGCSLGFICSLLIEGCPTTPIIICTIGLSAFLVRLWMIVRIAKKVKNQIGGKMDLV